MKVTIEIDSQEELAKFSALLKEFDVDNIKVISPQKKEPTITKGDKSIDPRSLFGIWANDPRDINSIRIAGWKRNNNL